MSFLLLVVFSAVFATGQTSDAEDLAGAESLRREAVRQAEQKYGPEDKRLAPALTNLALALHALGRDAEGEPFARRAFLIAEQSGDRRLMGATLNGLGVVLAGEGDKARAQPVLRRSVALLEESEGAYTLHAAQAANNLATLYSDTGQFALAEQELTRALPSTKSSLARKSPLLRDGDEQYVYGSCMNSAAWRKRNRTCAAPWPSERKNFPTR